MPAGKIHSDKEMQLRAQSRAGSPMRRVACTNCAKYQDHLQSPMPAGPYCPTFASGCAHLND
eukprot:scaffold113547_cov27-Tisochrysis_lutea.AAC.2